jgi:NmrA-like family
LSAGPRASREGRWRAASSSEVSGCVRSPGIRRSPREKSWPDLGPRSRAETLRTASPSSGCSMVSTACSRSSSSSRLGQDAQLADAAKAAGVDHYVYSSVGSAHRETGIPHFDSKWEVEEHVRASGVPYTVLRPVYFMQNWEMMREPILGGTLPQPLDPDKPFQMLDADDIGVFAAMAFENPDEWIGREVDLAGDEMTMPEIADAFSRVIGSEVHYFQTPWDQFEEQMGEEFTVMYRWFNDYGYEADVAGLRKEHPGLVSFEQYLRSHGWENAEVPSRA